MDKNVIIEKYSRAAESTEANLCCPVNYRKEFRAEEIDHIPEEVMSRNYGCGVPAGLREIQPGQSALDLGPGLGRDCFIAARKVGPEGRVFGLDMNDRMLKQAEHYKAKVVERLGYDNIRFLKGQFDVEIPLEDSSVNVIFSNCVNNLALDKRTAYREMFRVLKPGSKLSFADVVSDRPLPHLLRENEEAWADCVAGVLPFNELTHVLNAAGFHGVTLRTDYLWKKGQAVVDEYFGNDRLSAQQRNELETVRLYSVNIEAHKPVIDPKSECYWKGQFAAYQGPGVAFQLDSDPDHLFPAGTLKEVCEKTATILQSAPFNQHFTVFEPEGEVEARPCIPGSKCC